MEKSMTIKTRKTELLWWPYEWVVDLLLANGKHISPGEVITVILIVGVDSEFIEREVAA